MRETVGTILYGLRVITHPFEGYWELKKRKPRAKLAALCIYLAAILALYLRVQMSGFLFRATDADGYNALISMCSLAAPILLYCLVNWAITTLFDGKGRLGDVFVYVSYALLPLVLVYVPVTVLSHLLTLEEGVFLAVGDVAVVLWGVFLVLAGSVTVHDYSMFKSVVTALCTVAGIVALVFLLMVVYSAVSQLIGFFATLVMEIRYW